MNAIKRFAESKLFHWLMKIGAGLDILLGILPVSGFWFWSLFAVEIIGGAIWFWLTTDRTPDPA
jgi:hypothetical protein